MYSKTSIAGHPVHAMLVAFPIVLYVLTFVGFAVYNFASAEIFWYRLGFFSNVGAVVMALFAAIPGFIDWGFGIPKRTEAKKDGLIHMVLNLVVLSFFAVNLILIAGSWEAPLLSLGMPLVLTGAGCLVLLAAATYGWIMVGFHKVGVNMSPEQEHLQAHYEHEERREEPTVFH
ncbi:MAG: DUF2231 domain-containing protein [Bdellovibrio sp.]|nr:DUF2231 domain-containing protein [Bdellovibrio sp.]